MSTLRGVIFDVDGTLVDSNDEHASAWVEAFGHAGYDVAFARVRAMVGMGGDKIIPIVTGLPKDGDAATAIGAERDRIFMQRYVPAIKPFPGVRPLFERIRAAGTRIFIATSAKPESLKVLLRIANVTDLLTATASKADAENSKPDPGIVEAAVRDSGFPVSDLVMVGDTPYDMEASLRAHVRPIAFRCGGWKDDELAGAVRMYDGAWDMLERYEDFERSFD